MKIPEFEGRVALVTGASRGIGQAIAVRLAQDGCNVIINYYQNEEGARETAATADEFGVKTQLVQADVKQKAQVERLFDSVVETWNRLDYLVNNSGILYRTPFLEITETEWNQLMQTNVRGYFLAGQAAAAQMAQQDDPPGAIVNISSGAAFRTGSSGGHYNVSKAAVTMLTKQMARELAEHGIRVNEVCPGLVVTDMNREDVKDPEFRKNRLSSIPLGKFGEPEDVADAVAFLLSDSAKHTTGASLRVDGGSTL